MPKAQSRNTKRSKPAPAKAKSATKKAAVKAKPAKPVESKSAKSAEVKVQEAAAVPPTQEATPPNPAIAKPKAAPHAGKPEQPIWARFNQSHNQKMPKGRFFRHQGR